MPEHETRVARHYSGGDILASIKAGLAAAGADQEAPRPEDLKAVDEFHTGGLEATEALLGPLGINAETRVLDIGSGIGGTARFIATHYGARVDGVDLTPGFVETAVALSAMCGLADRTFFHVGSALDLPTSAGTFDLATMLHVGMNIENKAAIFTEVYDALAPGGRFALFDIMRASDGEIVFPVPWSSSPDTSFVDRPQVYRDAATAADFELVHERDRGEFARDFFRRAMAAVEANGGQPGLVGLHLIMGPAASDKYGNAIRAALGGITAPWEMVFRKPA